MSPHLDPLIFFFTLEDCQLSENTYVVGFELEFYLLKLQASLTIRYPLGQGVEIASVQIFPSNKIQPKFVPKYLDWSLHREHERPAYEM